MGNPAERIAALAACHERLRQWALADRMKLRHAAAMGKPVPESQRQSLRSMGAQARGTFEDLVRAVANAGGAQ